MMSEPPAALRPRLGLANPLWMFLALVLASVSAWAQRLTATPPNIILLVLDDQDGYSPFWDAMPVMSGLRDAGICFQNAFAPTPISAPGRLTLLTGKLAHNTGVYTLSGPYGPGNFQGKATQFFVTGLDRAGYCTAHIGKPWGTGTQDPGWDYWLCLGGADMYAGQTFDVSEKALDGKKYSYTQTEYSTDFICKKALKFLTNSTTPFFLWLSPTAPHLPLPPAARHTATAKAQWLNGLPLRVNFNEADISDKSAWLRNSGSVRSGGTPYAVQEYHKRMGSLMAADEMMGRLRDTLVSQGRWSNTIVMMVSDNGYNLGSHRLIHKEAPYEESIRVPVCVSGAGVATGVITRIVGLHDIAPTILDLAGVAASGPLSDKCLGLSRGEVSIQNRSVPPLAVGDMDGKSLAPFLSTGSDTAVANWRTSIVTEYKSGGVTPGYNPGGAIGDAWELDIPTYRSLRTETAKLIQFTASGDEELYDLVNDPDELNNLVVTDPSGSAALRATLRARLEAEATLSGANNP